MNVTPSHPSFTGLERPRAQITPPRTATPLAALGTVVFAVLLVLLLTWIGRTLVPQSYDLFRGGR